MHKNYRSVVRHFQVILADKIWNLALILTFGKSFAFGLPHHF